jgi:hypothetical protein
MRLTPVIHLAVVLGLSAGIASAQGRADRFVARDANGDGVLTPNEYQTSGGHPGNFRALDANGDGVLTKNEFLGKEGSRVQDDPALYKDQGIYTDGPGVVYQDPDVLVKVPFRKLDQNRDNRLTKREWAVDSATFRSLDRNRDGYVSAAEYAGAPGAGRGDNGFSVKDKNGDGVLTTREYGDPASFDRVDRNDDRRITYDEFLNPPAAATRMELFDQLDRNRDGILTQGEWTGNLADFRNLDGNRDGRVNRGEFGS